MGVLILLLSFLLTGCKTQEALPDAQAGSKAASDSSSALEAPSQRDPAGTESTGSDSASEYGQQGSETWTSEASGSASDQPTYPAPTGEPWVSDVPIDGEKPVELDGLRFTSFGTYSGVYVEDGSDKAVEDVAVVLVMNTTERYLELATFSFEIDGASATFTVTNLPPQKGAWILARDALTVNSGASFVLKGGTTSFCTPEDVPAIAAQPSDGTVLVENRSATEAFSGYIYYKAVYEDGNYLGGVTYRTLIENLPAQSQTEITAAHCDEASEIVRVMSAS